MKSFLNLKHERNTNENEDDIHSNFTTQNDKFKSEEEDPTKISNNSIKISLSSQNNNESYCKLFYELNDINKITNCSICNKNITKTIKIICTNCSNQIFCINCLLLQKHFPFHYYKIIDALNFPLFTENFTAKDEINFLSELINIGSLFNWEKLSKKLLKHNEIELQSHYFSFYKENDLKDNQIIINENKEIIKEISEKNKNKENNKIEEIKKEIEKEGEKDKIEINKKINTRNRRSLCIRKNNINNQNITAREILGYRQKRNEFDIEFLNDAELELNELEFLDNDKEEDIIDKKDILKNYNIKINEREERKNFIIKKGLLDLKKQNHIENILSRDKYELLVYLKNYARFFNNSEFFDLFEGIILEMELKFMIKNLSKLENEKNSKGNKINSIEDIEKYLDIERNLNRAKKSGNLFANIPEPKKLTSFLGHKLDKFFNYDNVLRKNENDKEKIFDKDEYDFIKEIPVPLSTMLEISKKIKFYFSYDKKENENKLKEILEEYDMETQTRNDIFNFYCKKFLNKDENFNLNISMMNNNTDYGKDKNLFGLNGYNKYNGDEFYVNSPFFIKNQYKSNTIENTIKDFKDKLNKDNQNYS